MTASKKAVGGGAFRSDSYCVRLPDAQYSGKGEKVAPQELTAIAAQPYDQDSSDSFVVLLPVPKSANSASEAMPPLASEV
jgi:hypothetical protein